VEPAPSANIGKIIHRVSVDSRIATPAASPVPEMVFRIDPDSLRYNGYKEFTPDSLPVQPDQFMERRIYDVVPATVAEMAARAIFKARREAVAESYGVAVFGRWWDCHMVVQKDAHLSVSRRPRR